MADLYRLRPLARWLGRQRWIRFGIRDRFARAVENPVLTHGQQFRQSFSGGSYVGNTGNFIDWSARYFGAYGREELDLFADLYIAAAAKGRGGAVIDVGANVGHHSLFYGLMGADVLSFEPNPVAMALLKQKVAANPSVRIHAIQKGLSDRADRLLLSIPNNNNLGSASLVKQVGSTSVVVEVCCGDQVEEIQCQQQIDLIKIDVEGHELHTLAGLRQTIATHLPPVFFEWNGGGRFAEAKSIFPKCYVFYRFLGDQTVAFLLNRPGYRLQPLDSATEPELCNVLAWPTYPLPMHFSQRLCM